MATKATVTVKTYMVKAMRNPLDPRTEDILKWLRLLDLWWTETRERRWVRSEVIKRIRQGAHCTEPEKEEEIFEELLHWVALHDSLDEEFEVARNNIRNPETI